MGSSEPPTKSSSVHTMRASCTVMAPGIAPYRRGQPARLNEANGSEVKIKQKSRDGSVPLRQGKEIYADNVELDFGGAMGHMDSVKDIKHG